MWIRGHQSLSQHALYCFRCFFLHIGHTNPCLLSVSQSSFPYFVFWFPGSSEKLEMRGIDLRTSRMLSERSTIWATSPLRKRGANAISNLSSVNAIVERSSFAYGSKDGFVVAGHQSMCFLHANRLHFRLRCFTGGVQRSYLFHTQVFDSLISRVMFPSTSFWGTPWRFAALIAFSASSVLFPMLPFAYSTYVWMSFLI